MSGMSPSLPIENKNRATVTLSTAHFEMLVEAAEDRIDRAAFAEFDRYVSAHGIDVVLAEALPVEAVEKLAAGVNPLRVWREQRGMSATALAAASGVQISYISEIENGKKIGSVTAMGKCARALRVSIEAVTP